MKIFTFLIYVLFSSAGLILFKLGSGNTTFALNLLGFKISLSIKMIIGVLCYGISFLLWLYIVSYSKLSFVYPLSIALVNIVVLFGSCVFLKESITLTHVIGMVIIIIGVSLMSIGD